MNLINSNSHGYLNRGLNDLWLHRKSKKCVTHLSIMLLKSKTPVINFAAYLWGKKYFYFLTVILNTININTPLINNSTINTGSLLCLWLVWYWQNTSWPVVAVICESCHYSSCGETGISPELYWEQQLVLSEWQSSTLQERVSLYKGHHRGSWKRLRVDLFHVNDRWIIFTMC